MISLDYANSYISLTVYTGLEFLRGICTLHKHFSTADKDVGNTYLNDTT